VRRLSPFGASARTRFRPPTSRKHLKRTPYRRPCAGGDPAFFFTLRAKPQEKRDPRLRGDDGNCSKATFPFRRLVILNSFSCAGLRLRIHRAAQTGALNSKPLSRLANRATGLPTGWTLSRRPAQLNKFRVTAGMSGERTLLLGTLPSSPHCRAAQFLLSRPSKGQSRSDLPTRRPARQKWTEKRVLQHRRVNQKTVGRKIQ